MLQRSMQSQLARLRSPLEVLRRMNMNLAELGPTKVLLNSAKKELKRMRGGCNHWIAGGPRSVAVAVNLLQDSQVIALPTDTIYGLAGLAQNNDTIRRLYEIKNRDENKPLAICVGAIADVGKWGMIEELPRGLVKSLLPGPVTLVLRRTPELNPLLNPGTMNVGIRIPNSKFIRAVAKLVGEPLALTSANESNKPSTLIPEEFSELWPLLGAVFYPMSNKATHECSERAGSTVVDLSEAGKYKILRDGSALDTTVSVLQRFGLEKYDS